MEPYFLWILASYILFCFWYFVGTIFFRLHFCSLMALSDSEDDYCYLIFNLVKVTLLLILFLFGPLLCLYANKLIGFQAFNFRVKPTFFFQTSIPPSQVIVFIVYVHSRCWKSVCLVWFLTKFSFYLCDLSWYCTKNERSLFGQSLLVQKQAEVI